MTDVNRIDLILINDTWIARHTGPYSHTVLEEFGTVSLPTPFTGLTPAEEVERVIRALNPGFIVEARYADGDLNHKPIGGSL